MSNLVKLIMLFSRVSSSVVGALVQRVNYPVSPSNLDYCNSPFHSIALKDILKRQRVQNCLAKATRSPRVSNSVPLL